MAKKIDGKGDVTSSEHENLTLWNQVCETPSKWTRDFSRNGRKLTDINQQWQVMEATKLWGPYGGRWGLINIEHEIVPTEATDRSGTRYDAASVIVSAVFFYPGPDGKEIEFPIVNDGLFVPGDDSLKKVVTNTRSKALSWLGFSADVFLGQFDDLPPGTPAPSGKPNPIVKGATAAINAAKDLDAIAEYRNRVDASLERKEITEQEANQLRELCDSAEFGLS